MKSSLRFIVVGLVAGLVACGAPAAEEAGEGADAISDREAAREFQGAEIVIRSMAASGTVSALLPVRSWSVWAVSNRDFEGAVLFAKDAEDDVRYAVLVGRSANDNKLALVNYDKSGRTAATALDKATLDLLGADVAAIRARLAEEARRSASCRAALGLVAGSVALVSVGWLLLAPATTALAAGWVSTAVTGTGVALVGGGYVAAMAGGFSLVGMAEGLGNCRSLR